MTVCAGNLFPFPNDCLSLISDFNWEAGLRKHFGSISRLGSGRHVKRSVKNACCALCGDVKYTPPARKKLAHARKARSRCPSQPNRLEQAMVHPVARAKMTNRVIIWVRRHLQVKLCDVAHVFDVTSRDFSCILPAVLLQKRKHKKVKCFSEEFRSLTRLDPQGSGSYGKWIGNQSWEVYTPTNSCASLSSGNQVLGFSVGERILDVTEDVEGWSKSSNKHILRMPDCEGMRLSSVEGTAYVPLNLGEAHHRVETAGYVSKGSSVASEVQEVKASPVCRVPPLLLRRVRGSNGFASSQCVQHVDLADNLTVGKTGTNDSSMVKNGLNDGSEENDDSSDYFSCQRTTAYTVWPRLSCARTYRPWPFPRHGPPSEIMALDCTGPRWIVTPEVSEGAKNVINDMQIDFNTGSERTVESNRKESLKSFEPHWSFVVHDDQGQVQSTTESERVMASPTLEETSECQTNPGKASTPVSSAGECSQHSCNMFQQDFTYLGSELENDSQAVDIHSPLVINSDKLDAIPAGSVNTVDTKSLKPSESSMNRTRDTMLCKCPEDSENNAEATTFHLPHPLPDLQQSAFQNLSYIEYSREALPTSTVMVPSSVEPKSLVMAHPKEEQKSDFDVEKRSSCSRSDYLQTTVADQNTSSPTCTGSNPWDTPFKSMSNRDLFSSSEENISGPSPTKRPEGSDAECSLLQYEMREIGEANGSASPLLAPASSVVTGANLDVVRAYEDDAILLDVIQDDPDLFGAVMGSTEMSASKANPAVQREKNMCMQIDQTTLVSKPRRIVWDLESGRYVGCVYKQAHFLCFTNLVF